VKRAMYLDELLQSLNEQVNKPITVPKNFEFSGMELDSRKVQKGDLFIALAGSKEHGLAHADEVIGKGANAIIYEPDKGGSALARNITGVLMIPVPGLAQYLGVLAASYYGQPSSKLMVIGITGTNGKTSCSQFLGQMLNDCGIIGTLGWGAWGKLNSTVNTTPDALAIQEIMADFFAAGKKAVAMEVSSHGLAQGRVNGVHFHGAVYTNITRDHLDYHETMEAYTAAKLQLLQVPGLEFVVINLDFALSSEVIFNVPAGVKIWGVSANEKTLANGENLTAEKIEHCAEGIRFTAVCKGLRENIIVPLYGDFNLENILCVLAVMLALGFTLSEAKAKLMELKPVPGRMEKCGDGLNQILVFVDYAHTPDALDRVLGSLRKHCRQTLWVVFGCGGDRDAGKRPLMGSIAERWADKVIVTDDNPRYEDNQQIASEIMAGCYSGKVKQILDRKMAIGYAIENAGQDDCIVIAGKGHEEYQEIAGIRYPFSDKHIAEAALAMRGAA
jgi:UDP-N-acetylmuramoyl-L-alanyl-D-glutamate--2,6-diaminopimelate ligase